MPAHMQRTGACMISGHDFCRAQCRGDDYAERAVLTRVLSLLMLLVSIIMALWGGYNFQKRAVYLE